MRTETLQKTIGSPCRFEGIGLHSGRKVKMSVLPAPANTGIVFRRTDLGADAFVAAVAENVTSTARCTAISSGRASVYTVEHLLSALYGLGIDNAVVELDNVEVPALDGSASAFVRAFQDNAREQEAERKALFLDREIEFRDDRTGAWIKAAPADHPSFDITVDFNSKVLGVQSVHWDRSMDYASEIGNCRTFVFFHEIIPLLDLGLIKGGDVDNAIVIVEQPVEPETLRRVAELMGRPLVHINAQGYLDHIRLRFDNECARHKMLDLLGDLSLAGFGLNARVTAFKPGHALNTGMAKRIRALADL